MGKISTDDVKKIAVLSRLQLTEAEVSRFSEQLESILTYIDTLAEVDVAGVVPFAGPQTDETALRADVPGTVLPRAAALQNAPQADENFFMVPAVVK